MTISEGGTKEEVVPSIYNINVLKTNVKPANSEVVDPELVLGVSRACNHDEHEADFGNE